MLRGPSSAPAERVEAEAVRQGRLQGAGEEELAVMKERSGRERRLAGCLGKALEKKAGGLAPSLCIRPLQASRLTPEEVITTPLR